MLIFITLAPMFSKRHHLRWVRLVVHFKAVLQGEGVNVHDDRRFAGLRQNVRVVQNLVFLHRHQKNVHLVLGRFQKLVAEVHVRNIERDVLARFGLNPVVQLFLGHQRHAHALYDHRMA